MPDSGDLKGANRPHLTVPPRYQKRLYVRSKVNFVLNMPAAETARVLPRQMSEIWSAGIEQTVFKQIPRAPELLNSTISALIAVINYLINGI